VDRAAFAVAFATRLRQRGVPVGFPAIEDFVRALGASQPRTKSALYWTARICLVRRRSELPAFDAVFDAAFADAILPLDPHARRRPVGGVGGRDRGGEGPKVSDNSDAGGLPWATLSPATGEAEDTDSPVVVPELLPSAFEGLADLPFEELSEARMRQLGEWLATATASWPTRRSRRFAVSPRGRRIAVRPTVARSRRTGWEPVELVRVRAVRRPRRVLMLCDVSQSMRAQATAYLHLMRALALVTDAEVFAFATRLTRLTPVLTHRSAPVAIEQATAKVTDRFGGTRIATNVHTLLASRHGGSARGAIVIIASDGWDSDPPERLAAELARLHRRAHRLLWINPRVSAPGFEPTVSTMAAALPYCDRLLPADTFRTLRDVIDEIARCQNEKPARFSSTG
jgi:uncharacterized protein